MHAAEYKLGISGVIVQPVQHNERYERILRNESCDGGSKYTFINSNNSLVLVEDINP